MNRLFLLMSVLCGVALSVNVTIIHPIGDSHMDHLTKPSVFAFARYDITVQSIALPYGGRNMCVRLQSTIDQLTFNQQSIVIVMKYENYWTSDIRCNGAWKLTDYLYFANPIIENAKNSELRFEQIDQSISHIGNWTGMAEWLAKRYSYVYTGNEAVEKDSYLMHVLVLAGVLVLATFTGWAISSCIANCRHARYMEAMDAEGGLPLSGVDELLSRVEELHPNDPEEDEEDYDIYLDSPEEPFSIDYYNYVDYYDC